MRPLALVLGASFWIAHASVARADPAPPAASFPIEEGPKKPTPVRSPVDTAPASAPATNTNASAVVSEPPPPPPAVVTAQEAPRVEAPRLVPPLYVEDNDAVFRAFARYAETQARARIAAAIGGVVIGAATIGTGVAFANYFDVAPEPFIILGSLAAVAPLLGLLSASSAEGYAKDVRADASGHSLDEALALRRAWAGFAQKARVERNIGSGVGIALGVASFGFGVAVLDGAFSMQDNDRAFIGSVMMGLGGAMVASGITGFFVKSPVETAYEQYEATRPPGARPAFGMSVGPTHAQLSLRLAF
jgi:hypothetical protein